MGILDQLLSVITQAESLGAATYTHAEGKAELPAHCGLNALYALYKPRRCGKLNADNVPPQVFQDWYAADSTTSW